MNKLNSIKKFAALFSFFVLTAFIAKGQGNLPPVIEIKTDTAAYQDIDDKYWQLLEDPLGKLTIEQVSTEPYISKFHTNTTRTKGYDYNINTYWLRYRLKNELAKPIKITIPESVSYAWLYTSAPNNKWKVQANGTMLPWSKRDGLKRINHFVVSLEPGQEITIFEREVFNFTLYKPKVFPFTIGFADHVIEQAYINNDGDYFGAIINSLLLGMLLLTALVNLLFYRIVREKVYFYFSLFVLCVGLNNFINATNIAIFREHRYLNLYLNVLCIIVLFFTIMHFIRLFLSTKIYTPKWDRFLILLSYVLVIDWIAVFFLPPSLPFGTYFTLSLIFQGLAYIYFPIIMATLLFYIPRNKGINRAGIIATLPAFAWWSFGYAYMYICQQLKATYNTPFSDFYVWLSQRNDLIQLMCLIWLVIIFSWILFHRFKDMQQMVVQSSLDKERLAKEKEIERSQLIEKQNEELEQQVAERTADLNQSLINLKATQTQLIQSEKMASLGELTAGIAHEIQNPLNFVNNFSDVNREMIDELKQALKGGNVAEAIVIADDLQQNEEKINHHGKRADNIVKGMLQHSQSGSGTKEPVNINALADEYLRLAYHGLRAKDKSFNAELITNFDNKLSKVNVIPQDMGRVLLNLFNNAFYAVNQKQKTAGTDYKPEVSVTTTTENGQVIIKVKDNGTGIPDPIKDKIMQPFFTTKPTGEGTGLGLSLTYDMVVKGHGGSIAINTSAGNGAEFIIKLPNQHQ